MRLLASCRCERPPELGFHLLVRATEDSEKFGSGATQLGLEHSHAGAALQCVIGRGEAGARLIRLCQRGDEDTFDARAVARRMVAMFRLVQGLADA